MLDHEARPIILVSRLAEHTRNLEADARASLVVRDDGDEVLAGARLTLIGNAARIECDPALRARFLRYQPQARQLLGLGDFSYWRITPLTLRFIAGFGAIRWISAAEFAPPKHALAEVEADIIAHMNAGHADTLRHAAAAVRPGGVVSVLGVFWSAIRLNPFPLLLKEVTLAWSYCYHHGEETADFADAVQILDAERARAARLATHTVPLDEVERAFTLAGDKKAGVVKVSVIP